MFEVQILIPTASNEGVAFDAAHHLAFEAFVVARFGGLTLYPANAVGAWVEAGKTYHDATRIYGVALRSLVQGAQIGEVVEYAKRHYGQLAIYVRYLGLSEVL